MDHVTMRKRGWSIQSDQSTNHAKRERAEEHQRDDDSATAASAGEELELDDHEKQELLHAAFPGVNEGEQGVVVVDDDHPPTRKRRKTGDESLDGLTHDHLKEEQPGTTSDTNKKEEMLQVAKTKLSKWAARLFDPDRPRGLVQAPQTIPLNDEFLAAFGKREREMDSKLGRTIELNPEIVDDDNIDESSQDRETGSLDAKKRSPVEERKIKIANLAYTTSEATLEAACLKFGPLENVNLIMDKERTNLNVGRAYVTFESSEGANACIDGLQTLEGRPLRISIAPSETKRIVRRAMGGSTSRYWVKDISTKCFRCGQVGHMESDCPNAATPKPCPLCGGIGHDMRSCPKSRVCFRCGVPGHINRECSYRQNLPKRVICSICFQSGHHRWSCRRRATDAPSYDAVCFVCHKRGHFMCKEMKWFYGLEGVSCFNCGRAGHHGYDCDRPGVDVCSRDDEMADREIDRAEAMSLADELEQQRQRSRRHRRDRGYDGDRARARSQPVRQSRSSNDGGSRRSSGDEWNGESSSRRREKDRDEERRSHKRRKEPRGYDMSNGHDKRWRR